ncbi:MAG TPA: GTPase domain-containing protein [Roseiflexaceae bacterium]|nr:GTPase domain-containing protein [Roseiflexaceae bacterium]
MALVDAEKGEIHSKLVYYGPAAGGKTSNLQHIHWDLPATARGDLLSIATETERTLFFRCQPPGQPPVNGLRVFFHLYAVPGCMLRREARHDVLRGADGVVFVADSQSVKLQLSLELLRELMMSLVLHGKDPRRLPIVLQYNKRDVPKAVPVERMDHYLNRSGWPRFLSSAAEGYGIMETFDAIRALVTTQLERR